MVDQSMAQDEAIVNTLPKLSPKVDLFATVSNALNGRGLLILRRIAYLCAKNGEDSCTVPHKNLAKHAKCSVNTVKKKLRILEDFDFILIENRKSSWGKDKDGKRKRIWRSNRYVLKEQGFLYLMRLKSGRKLTMPTTTVRCVDDVWNRRRANHEPHTTVSQVCELQEQIKHQKEKQPEQHVAPEVATNLIIKKEKKGFSHEQGRRTQEDERRDDPSHTGGGERTDCASTGGHRRNVERVGEATGDDRKPISLERTGNYDDNKSSTCGENRKENHRVHAKGNETEGTESTFGLHKREVRKSTHDQLQEQVKFMTEQDSHVFGLIPRKVENLLRDGIDPWVILESLKEIVKRRVKQWNYLIEVFIKQFRGVKEQEGRRRERILAEERSRKAEFDELDRQKAERTGAIDLVGMVKQFQLAT